MKAKKEKLSVIPFGNLLVGTGDLDPLYIALWRASLPRQTLCRWLVAYWCYYHAGLSSKLSERRGKLFWQGMEEVAAGGKEFPRGTERRHFRGRTATVGVQRLREQFPKAEDVVDWVAEAGPRADAMMKRVTKLYGFGDWIKWKVPDMIDRLDLAEVEFVDRDVDYMFDASLKGAKLTADKYCKGGGDDHLMAAHYYLINRLDKLTSPPRHERTLNVQETETIFCKWKSHLNGHYPMGKDIDDILEGLLRYGRSKTSQSLIGPLRELKEHGDKQQKGE